MKEDQLNRAIECYGDMVYRIAMSVLGKPEDAEDAVQNTFLRYYRKAPAFQSAEHEKAWLIRCGINASKSLYKSLNRHRHENIADYRQAAVPDELPNLLWYLPAEDRVVLQLRYVEGYTSPEIADLLKKSPTAIRKQIERAKKRARALYEKEVLA